MVLKNLDRAILRFVERRGRNVERILRGRGRGAQNLIQIEGGTKKNGFVAVRGDSSEKSKCRRDCSRYIRTDPVVRTDS